MALFSQSDLLAAMPEAIQLLAADDAATAEDLEDADVVAVFDAIVAEATDWITGYLEQAGLTLAATPPTRLKHLGIKYAEYTLWRRRGHADRAKQIYEEWIKPGADWLAKIASGAESLSPPAEDDEPSGAIIEDSKTYNPGGLMV